MTPAAWPAPLAARHVGRLVVVEPLGAAHADGLWAAATQSDWAWMPTDASVSRQRFDAWLAAALDASAAGAETAFAVVERRSGTPVGSTRYLTLQPEHSSVEIGWTWYARRVWGAGVNVECKLLLLAYAFEALGCERVELKSDARNARSRAAMAALPAQFEGVHRRHRRLEDGSWRDTSWYSVIAPEWPAVRANLQRRLDRSPHPSKDRGV